MKVTLQFFLLVCILMFGVLLGMDRAEKGIYQIDGMPGEKTGAFHITRIDGDKMEISVLGKRYLADREGNIQSPLEAGVEQSEQQQKGNQMAKLPSRGMISEMGNRLGGWVHQGAKRGLEWLVSQLGE